MFDHSAGPGCHSAGAASDFGRGCQRILLLGRSVVGRIRPRCEGTMARDHQAALRARRRNPYSTETALSRRQEPMCCGFSGSVSVSCYFSVRDQAARLPEWPTDSGANLRYKDTMRIRSWSRSARCFAGVRTGRAPARAPRERDLSDYSICNGECMLPPAIRCGWP